MSRRRPGNGSGTLLDMLSNLFYFSPLSRGRNGEGGSGIARERDGAATLHLPATLPRAHIDAIFQYRVKRPLASLPPPRLVSSRSPPGSFLREEDRMRGRGARNEKKGAQMEAAGVAGGMDRDERARSLYVASNENGARLGENRTFLHP